MVKLIETTTKEYARLERIELCCKTCGQIYANLADAKSRSGFWEIEEVDIDWDVNYTLVEDDIFCECYQRIGKIANGILTLYKKECKLFYKYGL